MATIDTAGEGLGTSAGVFDQQLGFNNGIVNANSHSHFYNTACEATFAIVAVAYSHKCNSACEDTIDAINGSNFK